MPLYRIAHHAATRTRTSTRRTATRSRAGSNAARCRVRVRALPRALRRRPRARASSPLPAPVWLDLAAAFDGDAEHYVARVHWLPGGDALAVHLVDRRQRR